VHARAEVVEQSGEALLALLSDEADGTFFALGGRR
jgi:hypothetical protein